MDDQPDNIRTLAAILQQEGYKVRKSLSGESALASACALPPDLILLDVRMPNMDGYQVCAALKCQTQTAQIPVIFLSALSETADKAQGFAIGAVDYITKPFQIEEVLIRIEYQLKLLQQQKEVARLNEQLLHCNRILEVQVRARTQALQQSLNFEATLKRISDKVRDSLDSQQVMQTALAELAQVLAVECCHATLYADDRPITHLCAKPERYPHHQPLAQQMVALPQLRTQLQRGEGFAFCLLSPASENLRTANWEPEDWRLAVLACPIFDDRVEHTGIAGILWLLRPASDSFREEELRLLEQVANQCAIALRQARLYEAAQQQVAELQRLNQLKDNFLSTVSHELRTPLATISLAADMIPPLISQMLGLTTPIPPDSKLVRYLKVLKEACQRELRLVDDLLSLQTLEAGTYPQQIIPLALPQWLPMILQPTLALAQSQQQTVILHLPPDLPTLATDAASINRIMTELVVNACKYSPPGSRITVAAQVIPNALGQAPGSEPSPLQHGYSDRSQGDQPTRLLQITVHNTGTAIPATEYDRIFEKFYRIPHQDPWKHGGTGLGLALVKKLVDYLGGEIGVASNEQGTRFWVQFAIAD
ncbi:hybrid sensor histidine kinase/response regulator [Trichothermofontia sp.]